MEFDKSQAVVVAVLLEEEHKINVVILIGKYLTPILVLIRQDRARLAQW